MTNNKNVLNWIEEMKALVEPDKVVWIDGSEAQLKELRDQALATGEMEASTLKSCPAACCIGRLSTMSHASKDARSFVRAKKRTPARPTTGRTQTSCTTSCASCLTAR